jgi:hypothetical protein
MILMFPVWEMRMFSILRSRFQSIPLFNIGRKRLLLTAMNDIVQMAVLECTAYLACKLAGDPFAQATVADDVVEHLAAVDIFEYHVVVVLVDDHFAHSANVGVVQEHRERRLAQRPDLLRSVL